MQEAPAMPVKFTRHNALQAVKKMYGDIEALVQHIADEHPDYLEGDETSPEIVAETLGIPMHAFLQIINHPSYQNALDAYAASQAYNLQARIRSMQEVAKVATGNQKLIMSPKGDPVYVDRDVGEMIAADKHLRNLQGRPLETGKGNMAPGGITIQFGDTHEETHQHVHLAPGNSGPQVEAGDTRPQFYARGQLDWDEGGPDSNERPEADTQPERPADPHVPAARRDEEQPQRNPRQTPRRSELGSAPQRNRTDDAHDDPSPHDTPYQPPQPGSGPPKGQARAYTSRASRQPFQSHDVEIVNGPEHPASRPTNTHSAAHMDKAERIRKIGFGLHQTPPTASAERQAKATDETPDYGFNTFLGGDIPITDLPRTQEGEDAEIATQRRADTYKANREEKLRQYLNRDRLVKGDED